MPGEYSRIGRIPESSPFFVGAHPGLGIVRANAVPTCSGKALQKCFLNDRVRSLCRHSAQPIPSFCKNHFDLQLFSNRLNSSGAEPEPAHSLSRTGTMNASRIAHSAGLVCLLLLAPPPIPARASKFTLPPETPAILDKIYSFDLDGPIEPANPL